MAFMLQTITGDTLTASHRSALAASKSYHRTANVATDREVVEADDDPAAPLILAGMVIPDPVFFCSVEPPSLAFQKPLDNALDCLVREDPSLRVTHEEDTGQTILGGMGELHLEIIQDRIRKVSLRWSFVLPLRSCPFVWLRTDVALHKHFYSNFFASLLGH
jgi:elongation factor G